jgi:hypothetical protein
MLLGEFESQEFIGTSLMRTRGIILELQACCVQDKERNAVHTRFAEAGPVLYARF